MMIMIDEMEIIKNIGCLLEIKVDKLDEQLGCMELLKAIHEVKYIDSLKVDIESNNYSFAQSASYIQALCGETGIV